MKLKRWTVLLAAVFLLSCKTVPAPAPDLDAHTEELIKTYSLTQMDRVATYLTELIVAGASASPSQKVPRILTCDPKRGVADTWMMPLKSLMDSKMSRERALYLQMPLEKRLKLWNDCETTCSCGAYGTLLQGIDESQLKPADIELRDRLLKKQGALSEKATRACALQVQWFCNSSLRSYLND